MTKYLLAAFLVLGVVACGPQGDDDDDSGPRLLNTGDYQAEGVVFQSNTCGVLSSSDAQGAWVFLGVTSTHIDMDGSPLLGTPILLERRYLEVSGTGSDAFDVAEVGQECIVDWDITVSGRNVADNVLRLTESIELHATGADCDAILADLGGTLPCTLEYQYTLRGADYPTPLPGPPDA